MVSPGPAAVDREGNHEFKSKKTIGREKRKGRQEDKVEHIHAKKLSSSSRLDGAGKGAPGS